MLSFLIVLSRALSFSFLLSSCTTSCPAISPVVSSLLYIFCAFLFPTTSLVFSSLFSCFLSCHPFLVFSFVLLLTLFFFSFVSRALSYPLSPALSSVFLFCVIMYLWSLLLFCILLWILNCLLCRFLSSFSSYFFWLVSCSVLYQILYCLLSLFSWIALSRPILLYSFYKFLLFAVFEHNLSSVLKFGKMTFCIKFQ